MDSGSTSLIETYAVYTGLVHPKPAEITQGETQRVVYDGRVHFNSPYTIKSQITKVKMLCIVWLQKHVQDEQGPSC